MSTKRKAIVFIDYENWYFSHIKLYGRKPKISEWHKSLERQFIELDVYFFADFSNFVNERHLIKKYANHIIDTKSYGRKSMTDFIMLDYIYQIAGKRVSPKTYILFSGDSHFEPVVNYLKNEKGKEVIIYGIRGSFSGQLKAAASKFIEIPEEYNQRELSIRMIIKKMDYLEKQQSKVKSPTYAELAQTISLQLDTKSKEIEEILDEMLSKQYLLKKDIRISEKISKTLILNKDKLERDMYYYNEMFYR